MITYSVQNPIDMCAVTWSFNDSLDRFYNWKNQPIDQVTRIPPRKIKIQLYIEDDDALNVSITPSLINASTGQEITGILYAILVPSSLSGYLFEITIDLSLINTGVNFYVNIDVDYEPDRSESIRSSCFTLDTNSDDKLIRIQFGNTVSNRPINGILFDPDGFFNFYLYANKYDTEIEIADDESETDYKGNTTLVEKTHQEIELYEIIDMPKKLFMSLIAISENDIIYFNGRRANFAFDKTTEARLGTYEVPFINALMRVTYADDNGLLNVRNNVTEGLLNLNSEGQLLINDDDKLKIQ